MQAQLKEISALLKEAREKVNKQRTAELVDEIGEAWRNRQFAQVHALRIEYARNGRGCKKRFHFSPRTTWGREDWIREMAKPASEGRIGCSEMDWDANNTIHVRQCNELASAELPDDMNVAVAVAQDKAAIQKYARKAPTRRAFHAWGIPQEALLFISDRQ